MSTNITVGAVWLLVGAVLIAYDLFRDSRYYFWRAGIVAVLIGALVQVDMISPLALVIQLIAFSVILLLFWNFGSFVCYGLLAITAWSEKTIFLYFFAFFVVSSLVVYLFWRNPEEGSFWKLKIFWKDVYIGLKNGANKMMSKTSNSEEKQK